MPHSSDIISSSGSHADQQALDDWAKKQNQEAFTALVQRHAGFVLAVSQRILGQGQQADDVVQAAFLMLSREAGNIRAHSLRTWLHRTTVRAALMQLRSERSRRDREKLAMADAPTEVAEVTDDAWEVLRPHIDQALDALPNAQRTIMVRHIMHGEKLVDLAVSLGQKPDAVRKQRDRAIIRLRSWFEKRGICASALIVAVERPIPAAEVSKTLFETCSHITTAPSPGALAIVKGMQTAMIIKTTLATAGLGLLGTIFGGLGYLAFSDQNPNVPTPRPMNPHVEQHQETTALSATQAENLEWRTWTIETKATPYGSFSPDGKYFLWSPLEPFVPDKGSSIHAWSLDDGLDHVRITNYEEYFRKSDDHTQSDPNTCWQSGPLACDDRLQYFVVQQTKPGLGAGLSWWMRIPALQGNHSPGDGQSAPIAFGSWPGPSLVAGKTRNERPAGTYRLVPGRSKDGHFAIHDPVTGDIRIFLEKSDGGFTVKARPIDKKSVVESNEVFWNGNHLAMLVSEQLMGGTRLEIHDLWSSDGSPLGDPFPILGHYMLEESLVINSDTLEPARILIRSLDSDGKRHEVCYQANASVDTKSWKEIWSWIYLDTLSGRKMLAWDSVHKRMFTFRIYGSNSDNIYFDQIMCKERKDGRRQGMHGVRVGNPQSWFEPRAAQRSVATHCNTIMTFRDQIKKND